MINKICEQLTKKNQNEELNLKDLMFFEKLSDACYCIIWTKNHQPRTITEIMDDYRNTNKITQADFDILKNSGSFNSLELNHILMGLPVGLGSECIPAPKIKV